MDTPKSISEWIRTQRELLRLERDEEQSQVADTIAKLSSQECMERGVSLLPLAVKGLSTGLYGRACVSVADPKNRPLPAHRFSPGDEVCLHGSKGSKGGGEDEGPSNITGVVGRVTELTVDLLSDNADDAGSLRPPLRLDVVASEATHRKLMQGLDALEKYPRGGPAERLINVLFGVEPPSSAAPSTAVPAVGLGTGAGAETAPSATSRLNDSQRHAVEFALATRDVALIHGPPGTGKTTTVVALVLEAVARGMRCLVCAPSNVAVDGILERLVTEGGHADGRTNGRPRLRVVRMGHPARLLPQVVEHSLEAIISRHDGTAIVKDVRGEIDALVKRLYPNADGSGGKSRRRLRPGDKRSAREELKLLRKEARAREDKVVREVLRSRDVVLATCVGVATHSLRDEEFDLVVIDEAAQALESACWIPILKGRRVVLAGDHKQLAPTVKSRKAQEGGRSSPMGLSESSADGVGSGGADGLGLTMFDRVLRDIGGGVCRMLDVQYRMNRDICDWASTEMYGGLLRADPSVARRTLPMLPHASKAQDMTAAVMLLIDTTGCDMHEDEAGGGSRRNEREAEVAMRHVKNLLEAGLLETEMAVISPYNGQVNLLKRLLRPEHGGVEVRSVDGFQGGEKEAIVLSLVRSNEGRRVGFLADARRLNVAVTRAKRHVAVVCDAECCGSDGFIGRLLRHIEERGEYRSALELNPTAPGSIESSSAQVSGRRAKESATVERGARFQGNAAVDDGSSGGVKGRQMSSTTSHSVATPRISDEGIFALVEAFVRENQPDLADGASSAGEGRGVEVSELELPVELTPRQRALVHELAEGLGLGHASKGEGANRTLVLSRRGQNAAAAAAAGTCDPSTAGECTGDAGYSIEISRNNENNEENTAEKNEARKETVQSTWGKEPEGVNDDDLAATNLIVQDPRRSAFPGSVSVDDKPLGRDVGVESKGVASGTVHPAGPEDSGSTARAAVAPCTEEAVRNSGNALLASLHAERSVRRPPPQAALKSNKRVGRGVGASSGGGRRAAPGLIPNDRGFAVEIPAAAVRSGGGASRKTSSTRGGESSKKGRQQMATAGGAAPAAAAAPGARAATVGGGTAGGYVGLGDDDNVDDDMAFLDAQIKAQRAAEPCYASLLRTTSAAMREKNPAWATAADKGKPSKSDITRAKRNQLRGALQSRLSRDEKKRGKASGRKEESK